MLGPRAAAARQEVVGRQHRWRHFDGGELGRVLRGARLGDAARVAVEGEAGVIQQGVRLADHLDHLPEVVAEGPNRLGLRHKAGADLGDCTCSQSRRNSILPARRLEWFVWARSQATCWP
jgi:hypothetical protein